MGEEKDACSGATPAPSKTALQLLEEKFGAKTYAIRKYYVENPDAGSDFPPHYFLSFNDAGRLIYELIPCHHCKILYREMCHSDHPQQKCNHCEAVLKCPREQKHMFCHDSLACDTRYWSGQEENFRAEFLRMKRLQEALAPLLNLRFGPLSRVQNLSESLPSLGDYFGVKEALVGHLQGMIEELQKLPGMLERDRDFAKQSREVAAKSARKAGEKWMERDKPEPPGYEGAAEIMEGCFLQELF